MSASPDRRSNVAEEVLACGRPPYALHTPPRERRARAAAAYAESPLQARKWMGPQDRGPDRSPWHAARILPILKAALAPSASIEQLLRGTNSAFLCASESRENRAVLRAVESLPAMLCFLFRRADDSPSGARVREHALNTFTVLLGEDTAFDENVLYDDALLPEVLPTALLDPRRTVVLAAARLSRRLSELEEPEGASRLLVLTDELFEALLRRYEGCKDVQIRTHLMCTFVNAAAEPRVQFCMARSTRLLQLLVDEVFNGGVVGAQLNSDAWEEGFRSAAGDGNDANGGSPAASRTPSAAPGSASATKKKPLRNHLSDVSPLRRYVSTPRKRRDSAATPRSEANRSFGTSVRVHGGHLRTAGTSHGDGAVSVLSSGRASAVDDAAHGALDVCHLALRAVENLLSSDEQCAEVKRLAPSLTQAVVECRTSPSEDVVAAANAVLRRLHDLDGEAIERELSHEVLVGRAVSQRVRSKQTPRFIGDEDDEDDEDGLLYGEDAAATATENRVGAPSPSPLQLLSKGIDLPDRVGASTTTAFGTGSSVAGASFAGVGSRPLPTGAESAARSGSEIGSAVDLLRSLLGH